ncbi:MAG: DUF6617 family protein [Bacteroidota bacterium]
MTPPLDLYNRILFLDLRPWQLSGISEAKFKQDLNDFQKTFHQFQPIYELSFPKPLSNKRKYFQTLIESEAIGFLNLIHQQINDSINDQAKIYLVHMALTRSLNAKLNEVHQIIIERDCNQDVLSSTPGSIKIDSSKADEAYILLNLKHQLVRLFLEVQDNYPQFLSTEPLSENEIYLTYFSHGSPDPSFIKKSSKIEHVSPANSLLNIQSSTNFKPIANDVRELAKGILSYPDIIKDSDRFASFEESLRSYDYIDDNYNFSDRHGMKNNLAMIYHHLINKGYFNKRKFPGKKGNKDIKGNKEIKEVDIRKFLDHRYNTDVDKQFRSYRNKPDEITAFVDKQYWLSSMTYC